MRELTCSPDAEVIGTLVYTYTDNLQAEEIRPVIEKYGLVDVDRFGWYSLSNLLKVLNELSHNANVMSNMVAIGMKIGADIPMPPGMENPTLPEVLMVWNDLYQAVHRNADVGKVVIEKVTDTHYKTIHSNPYPDDMTYGIMYAYGQRFLPRGSGFTVYYDEDEPARDHGGTSDSTIVHITWND